MTTFDYTPFDLQNPSGNNGLSSFALYFQRVMYREGQAILWTHRPKAEHNYSVV
jgi:hypothetical protein